MSSSSQSQGSTLAKYQIRVLQRKRYISYLEDCKSRLRRVANIHANVTAWFAFIVPRSPFTRELLMRNLLGIWRSISEFSSWCLHVSGIFRLPLDYFFLPPPPKPFIPSILSYSRSSIRNWRWAFEEIVLSFSRNSADKPNSVRILWQHRTIIPIASHYIVGLIVKS